MNISQFGGFPSSETIVERSLWCKYRTNRGDYLDGISGMYNAPLGFGRDDLVEVASNAMKNGFSHNFPIHPSNVMTSEPQKALTNQLLARIPFAKGVFYTNSGSEAVDAAIRMTRTVSRRTVVSLSRSYHGSTDLAHRASANLNERAPDDFLYYTFFSKDDPRSKEEWLHDFDLFLSVNGAEEIAAIIVEPMIGASGGLFMKENVLPEVHEIVKKYGIKFILDEVISGFWRLGKEFAHQLYDVQPDIVILSKAITNGMWPLSAVVVTDPQSVTLPSYGFTMAAHPVGCAIALKTLELLDLHGPNSVNIGQSFDRMMVDLPSNVEMVREGAFIAFHLYDNEGNRFSRDDNMGARIAKACFDNHKVIVRGNPLSVIVAPLFVDTYKGHMCNPRIAFALKEAFKECIPE